MKSQRLITAILIIISAADLVYTSRRWFVPVVCVLLALVSTSRRFKWDFSSYRRLLILVLSFLFVVKFHFFTSLDKTHSVQLVGDSQWYYIAEYFLALMALQFFLTVRKSLSAYLPFFGLLVLCGAGLALSHRQSLSVIQISGMIYIVLAVFFCGASRQAQQPAGDRNLKGRRLVMTLVLVFTVLGGWFGGIYWKKHGFALDQLLMNLQPSSDLVPQLFNLRFSPVGFSKETELDQVTNIRRTDAEETALCVFSPQPPGYLRAQAFERFTGIGWQTTADFETISPTNFIPEHLYLPGRANIFILHDTRSSNYNVMDIWPSSKIEFGMFAPLGVAVLEAPVNSVQINENDAFDSDDLRGGLNYQVATAIRATGAFLPEGLRAEYLRLPFAMDLRIRQLARRVFDGCDSPFQKIAAVTKYFQDNYSYRLGMIMPADREPLTYFLLDKPPAHCEYFATGAALLLRLAGVPTRYVTGFVPTEKNPYLGCWVARNKDAHAWVEAWDDQLNRWVLVEATAAGGVPVGSWPGKWRYLWDSVQFRLQELRVALHNQGFKGLLIWSYQRFLGLLVLLLTTTAGLLLIGCLLFLVAYGLLRKIRRSIKINNADPAVVALQGLLRRMDRRLGRHGLVRQPAETLYQFSLRIEFDAPVSVQPAASAAWYMRYARLRYGGQAGADDLQRLKTSIPKKIRDNP